MNILSIDRKIQENILNKYDKLHLLKSNKELEKVIEYLACDKDITKCKKQLEENREKLKYIEEEIKFYYIKSTTIIERYKILLSESIFLSLTKNKIQNSEKRDLIIEYLKVAREYDINPKIIDNKKKICKVCKETDFSEEEDFIQCNSCFSISLNSSKIFIKEEFIPNINIRKKEKKVIPIINEIYL